MVAPRANSMPPVVVAVEILPPVPQVKEEKEAPPVVVAALELILAKFSRIH